MIDCRVVEIKFIVLLIYRFINISIIEAFMDFLPIFGRLGSLCAALVTFIISNQ